MRQPGEIGSGHLCLAEWTPGLGRQKRKAAPVVRRGLLGEAGGYRRRPWSKSLGGSGHLDLDLGAGLRVREVDGAGDAGVEGVDGAQDLQRLVDVGELVVVLQRRLVGPGDALGVAGTGVPGGGDHRLVVVDLAVVDDDPVPQGAARGLHEAGALGVPGPGGWVPKGVVEGLGVALLDVGDEVIVPALHGVGDDLGLQGAGGGAPQGGEQGRDRDVQLAQGHVDQLLGLLVPGGVHHQDAGERPDLDRVALPARGLEPGVAVVDVELGIGGLDPAAPVVVEGRSRRHRGAGPCPCRPRSRTRSGRRIPGSGSRRAGPPRGSC